MSFANTDFAAIRRKKLADEDKNGDNSIKKMVASRRKGSIALSRLARGRMNYVDFPEDRARNFLTRTAERRSIVRANNDGPSNYD